MIHYHNTNLSERKTNQSFAAYLAARIFFCEKREDGMLFLFVQKS